MELSQEEKDKLYELIDKLNPCVAIASKETIERFKEWTKGQVKLLKFQTMIIFYYTKTRFIYYLLNHRINQ